MIYNMVCTCMHHIRLSQRRFSMAFSMSVAPGESTRADEIMWQLNVRMPVAWRWQWRSKAMGPMDVVMGAWLGDEHTQRGRERERIGAFFDNMLMRCDLMSIHWLPTRHFDVNCRICAGYTLGLWSIPTWSRMDSARLRLWSPHLSRLYSH